MIVTSLVLSNYSRRGTAKSITYPGLDKLILIDVR